MNSQKISVRRSKIILDRICQCDIFKNIDIIENINIKDSKLIINKIVFPYVICLNQECDLENDYKENSNHNNIEQLKDKCFLHIAIAPLFIFDQFLEGKHWGEILTSNPIPKGKKGNIGTKIKSIIDNEVPRYHYLNFPNSETELPKELIIDFKHFFTINRNFLYKNINKRVCSIDDLFREKISQRFSNYISRIGLPEYIE